MIIVSGLTKGIDTVAHETALEFGLKPFPYLQVGCSIFILQKIKSWLKKY
jgi:predicted Rossmann fold nucleotide-binding protein DprA/Smf involved in DNA uptake